MSTLTYHKILGQAAARVGTGGSITGSLPADIEANYNAFDSTKVDNAVFPFSLQADALLLAEEKIAQAISGVKNHPYRVWLRGVSDPLANRAVLPVLTSTGKAVVGVPGAIYDSSNNKVLTPPPAKNPLRAVERMIDLLADGALHGDYYHYAFDGTILLHTRTNVRMELCYYDRTAQKTAIANNQATLFGDALEELYVCGELSYLFENTEAPANIQQYLQYFADGIKRIETGGLINAYDPSNN